jgi:hypothetical protein
MVEQGDSIFSCRLSRAALAKLEKGPLRLSVKVSFLADGTSFTRRVRLPRLR